MCPTHIPVSSPTHLVPEAPTAGMAPALLRAPVHDTSSLSTQWYLHQGTCRAGCASTVECSWQVAPGQTDTDPPDLGVTTAVAPPHPSPPPRPGDDPCRAPCGVGGSEQQWGWPRRPVPCAGVRSLEGTARARGSGVAVVVLLCGCQAMASSNSKQREQRGRMLIRPARAIPKLPLASQSELPPKPARRGGPQPLSRQGSTVTKT